jgi:NCS1 family nucleobase:cation symporter-1
MASAFLSSGLDWQQSLGAVALGFSLISIPITLQGTMGARLNIPFPILVRGSFGMYLSYFCIISRSILAMFWFGISTATGGTLTVQCIRAIWPQFSSVPNELPPSANITTQGMIGYFVLYILPNDDAENSFVFQFPFLLIPGEKVRWFFLFKAIIVPIAFLAVLIWAMVAVGGFADSPIAEQQPSVSGSALGWAFMSALNASLGTYSTLGVNVAG